MTAEAECFVRTVAVNIIDCIQGSEEWIEARLGFVTASNFAKVLAKGQGKTRSLYMNKIAAERLTGMVEDGHYDQNMMHGNIVEEQAREYYSMLNDCIVDQVGFVTRDDDVGGSPDGLVGTCGMIEIKCPLSSTHIANIINNRMLPEYKPQVQGLLWITERQWCDFISYDYRVVANPLHVVRVERDSEYIKELAGKVGLFVKELKDIIEKIDSNF